MARLEYFIVCEATSVDAATNRVSLFNVLEDWFPEQFPDDIRRIEAVSLWHLDAGEEQNDYQAILRVTPPGMPTADFPMNLSRGRLKYRAVVGVRNIPLLQAGELRFEVLLNGQHHASHTVQIHELGAVVRWEQVARDRDPA